MTGKPLRFEQVSCHFGAFRALNGVSFEVPAGQRWGILGPNGAGKTTLINVACGLVRASSGHVFLGDDDITNRRPEAMAAMGISRSFQRTSVFPSLSVRDNLRLGVSSRYQRAVLNPWRSARVDAEIDGHVERLARAMELSDLLDEDAGTLSYGHQRQLEFAIALAGEPAALFLDEPTAGMSPDETDHICGVIEEHLPPSLTLLIIEHDVDVIKRLVDQIVIMAAGAVFRRGTPDEVLSDRDVQDMYLRRTHAEG